MMWVDTHCHLHFPEFDSDRAEVIARAEKAGVQTLINVGTDLKTNESARRLASEHDCMRHTAGLHPHHAHEADDKTIAEMEGFIQKTKPVAIGEIGLDYFKSAADASVQKKVFSQMLRMAQKFDLPVIVHSRNAFEDTYRLLVSENEGRLRGVMHCYSYDRESLRKLLDLGFLASFTATITYKNSTETLDAACFAPSDRILLETDSPYLAPQVFRGRRNEPSFLIETAAFLAQKRGVTAEELALVTSQNASRFFALEALP